MALTTPLSIGTLVQNFSGALEVSDFNDGLRKPTVIAKVRVGGPSSSATNQTFTRAEDDAGAAWPLGGQSGARYARTRDRCPSVSSRTC